MTEHTPAPWRYGDDCGDFEDGAHPCVYDATGNKLATFWVRRAVGAGADAVRLQCEYAASAEAAARLAAAAPALVAALKRLMSASAGREAQHSAKLPSAEGLRELCQAHEHAAAALAKVRP